MTEGLGVKIMDGGRTAVASSGMVDAGRVAAEDCCKGGTVAASRGTDKGFSLPVVCSVEGGVCFTRGYTVQSSPFSAALVGIGALGLAICRGGGPDGGLGRAVVRGGRNSSGSSPGNRPGGGPEGRGRGGEPFGGSKGGTRNPSAGERRVGAGDSDIIPVGDVIGPGRPI